MPRKAYLPELINDHDFKKLIKTEKDPKTRLRMLGMVHLQEGATVTDTANILKVSQRTVRNWIKSFTKYGLQGLYDKDRGGRRSKLNPTEMANLLSDIEELQNQRKGGRVKGLDIVDLIVDKYNVNYSLNGVYLLLHRVGMSWISARSKHSNSSLESQELFKKNFNKSQRIDTP